MAGDMEEICHQLWIQFAPQEHDWHILLSDDQVGGSVLGAEPFLKNARRPADSLSEM